MSAETGWVGVLQASKQVAENVCGDVFALHGDMGTDIEVKF